MTMHRVEMMEATLAELDNTEAAAILRQMSRNVAMIHDTEGGHELTTAEEFAIAASKFERPARIYNDIQAQAWDHAHVLTYIMLEGLEEEEGTPHEVVRRHMEDQERRRRGESELFRTNPAAWLEAQAAK